MSATSRVKKVVDVDDFAGIARRQREQLAARYEKYASDMALIGEPDLEGIFRSLIRDLHQGDASRPRSGGTAAEVFTPDTAALSSTEKPGMNGLWSAYSIWAFAVRNEIERFEEITSLNIPIDAEQLRSTLAAEARHCLDQAARYRVQRRLAFHADRLASNAAQFPDVRRIDTIEDFAHVALAIERHFLAMMRRLRGAKESLADAIEATENVIADLERTAGNTDVPGRLKNALKRLEVATRKPKTPTGASSGTIARVALEANRLFEFYDRLFETSQDTQVTAAAQRMAGHVVDRMRLLRGAQPAA